MPRKEDQLVEPLESVVSEPEESKTTEPCWNCGTNLDDRFVCPDCGFDRKLIYNLNLESSKNIERE